MYGGFEDQRQRLPQDSVYDLRYEDLVADPVAEVEKIYSSLGLGDYSAVRDPLTEYVAGQKDYQTNKHPMDEGLKRQIRERWAGYFERYGYE
jgi:hypothetical protein